MKETWTWVQFSFSNPHKLLVHFIVLILPPNYTQKLHAKIFNKLESMGDKRALGVRGVVQLQYFHQLLVAFSILYISSLRHLQRTESLNPDPSLSPCIGQIKCIYSCLLLPRLSIILLVLPTWELLQCQEDRALLLFACCLFCYVFLLLDSGQDIRNAGG